MNPDQTPHGAVPTSSGKNRSATQRTLVVAAIVVAFMLVAMWVPW